mgnify:CR=1 FL=1
MKMDQMKTTHFDKKSLIAPIIIVVLLALAIGLIIFYITNPLFNEPQEGPFVQELQLSDNNVRILYNYVSYSVDGSRNDVFVMNSSVTKENMPSKDKLYYALQFASPEDFVSTGKRDDDNNQIFNISDNKVDAYMKRFFGNNVTYSKVKKMDYTLNFSDEHKYVGTLTYSYDNKGYDTILNKIDEEDDEKVYVQPFYGKLVKASLFEDQTMELQEKVIYTKVLEDDDLYTIKVYGDLHYHNLIETRNNLTESQLKNSVFNMNEYVNEASTVTYTFKTEDEKYYFYSSNLTNK